MQNENDIIEVNSVSEFEKTLNENTNYTLMPFQDIEQKINELLFELQMEDNRKVLEFKQKLKILKEKIEAQTNKNF